ncbi:MAG TPA: ATP-binding protein [Gemmatimonas sp.]|uniref:ATP-binding protein n=1 Tax=Gemmatimonas sp. TaxID=1962908 RepID=UPI002EDA117E
MILFRALWLSAFLGATLPVGTRPLAAQNPSPRSAPAPLSGAGVLELDDVAYSAFGRRDGLPDSPLHSLTRSRDGSVLLGTADRARYFTGRSWAPLPLPPTVTDGLIRMVLDASPHERYHVHNRYISIERDGQWVGRFELPVESAPIYSATLEARGDSTPRLIIGASGGVFVAKDSGLLTRLPLPRGVIDRDAMVVTRSINGVSELWVGTRGGGVSRLAGGQWTTWNTTADGLQNLNVEHLALTPAGDSASAIVATEDGAFLLVGRRWQRIGPTGSIARVLRVRVNDAIETWIGATSGHVFRSRDDQHWQPLELSPRTLGSRVQVLEAVDHGLGHPSIYIGFRSGVLLRLTVGVAGRVSSIPALLGHPIVGAAPQHVGDTLWFWGMNFGAFRLPDFRAVRTNESTRGGSDPRTRLHLSTGTKPNRLFTSTEGRFFERVGEQWTLRINAGESDFIFDLLEGPTPVGTQALIVVSARGAWYESAPSVFTRWPEFPIGARAAAIDSTSGRPQLVVALANGQVDRFDGQRWEVLSNDRPPIGNPVDVVAFRMPSGECALVLGGSDGLAMLRSCGGAPDWRLFTADHLRGLLGDDVKDLAALPDGRLAIASSRGLTVATLGRSFDDSLAVAESFTDLDGLPHPYVSTIGPLDSRGRLWVGTPLGVGFANVEGRRGHEVRPLLSLVQLRNGNGMLITQGARLAQAESRVEIDAYAMTFHREEETLYRFELDGTPITTPAWTDRGSATLPTLSPGRHTIRVRAVDYRGLEAVSSETQFVVMPPTWRSPLALITYGALLLGAGVLLDRRRNRSAVLRAREAEANEQRLATSEQRFRRLFEDGANPQLLVADGVVLQANRAVTQLLQTRAQPLIGRPVSTLIPRVAPLLASDSPTHRRECEVVDDHGEEIPVEVWHTRIPIDAAVLDHFEMRDLRERKRLEDERAELESQLRDAQRLESMGTLAGGVAHDFNNLLTVIHTNAELASSDVGSSTPAGEALSQLLVASHRAREVVRQILTFSRRTELRREPVRLSALLNETHSLLRSTIPSTVQVIITNEAPGATVIGDATQLQQLLLNLCSNAEYAMRATNGGTLGIHLRWLSDTSANGDGESVALTVTDTGVGMSPEVRARAFEPFFTTKPVGHGTGLGLSVLHGIVTSHGGSINVTSEPGQGAAIEIHLPASRVNEPEIQPATTPVPIEAGRRLRVLLVDDEDAVAGVMRRLLERSGFEVTMANNGAVGLERAMAGPAFDLVLTDQTMPVMTGMELVERLRASGDTTPIILASGFGAAIDGERVAHLRDVHRIDKPFASSDLLRLVRSAIGTS